MNGGVHEVPIRNVINKSLQTLTEKGHDLSNMLPILVKYNLSGHTSGKAIYKHNLIKLNKVLLNQYSDYFINHTVPHEVAHLVVFHLLGNTRPAKPHGNDWRILMIQLGLPPNRTHHYETISARPIAHGRAKPYRYKCNCRELMLSLTKHRRYMHGNKYRCVKCHSVIQYIGV